MLGVFGEQILSSHADQEELGRAMKLIFAALGGAAFALAQPAIWRAFARGSCSIMQAVGSQSAYANWLRHKITPERATTFGLIALVFFGASTIVMLLLIWTG